MIRLISDPAPADAIRLGLGEPTWEMPRVARDALAMIPDRCPYGPNAGRIDLREEIAAMHGVPNVDHVLVTVGTQGAMYCVFAAYLDPGDQLLVPTPGFVAYPTIGRMMGADVLPYKIDAESPFRINATEFRRVLDAAPRAKMAILNLPANPTGGAATTEVLREIAEACASRDVLLVSDEVYRDLYFDSRPPSLLDVTDRGVVLSSVSKAFGAPGLRVGWCVAPPELLRAAATVNSYAATATSHASQGAALALLKNRDSVLVEARAEIQTRFEALRGALREELDLHATPPDGSFYFWLPLPDRARANPVAFCEMLRDEAKVVLIPGLAFGEEGRRHARLSFAAFPDDLREGVRRFAPYWR